MGVGALKKHAKSPGHGDNSNAYLSSLSFFEAKQPRASSNPAPVVEEQPSVSEPIPSLFKSTSKTSSEIVWALNCINRGYSDNSTHFNETLRPICPDSQNAQDFQMRGDKLKYVTNHGLYPYYKDLLKSPFIVVMFDGSLNQVLQRSEMDIFIRC